MKGSGKKLLTLLLVAVLLLPTLVGCKKELVHFHEYEAASCSEPERCACGKTRGEALGHESSEPTCTQAATCTRCHRVVEAPLGHDLTDFLSCTDPRSCRRCGAEVGTALGHWYADATCSMPKMCERCGEITGTPLGHSFSSASCSSPQICLRCEETKGSPLGHNFTDATCTSPKVCTRCGRSDGAALGHHYADGKCIRCGEIDPDTLPVKLEELHLISGGGGPNSYYEYSKNKYTDTYGDTYDGAHRYITTGAIWDGVSSSHNLKRAYTTFSASIVAGEGMYADVIIEIYLDDVLEYSLRNYNRETGKVDVNLDVSGVQKLKIVVNYSIQRVACDIALVNAQLYK